MRFLIAMRANTWKKWRPWACSKLSGSIRSPERSGADSPPKGSSTLKPRQSTDRSTDRSSDNRRESHDQQQQESAFQGSVDQLPNVPERHAAGVLAFGTPCAASRRKTRLSPTPVTSSQRS